MRDGVVVPERVQRGLIELPRAEFSLWQSMGAGAPELAKGPVSRLTFASVGFNSF